MTGEQAEKRYYDLYREFMAVHVGPYSKPLVQEHIRRQAWAKLIAEVEADVIARTLLPTIERDAMPVRNCLQCGTFRTNHDVAQCEKDGCPLRTAPAEVVDHAAQLKADMEHSMIHQPLVSDGPQITHSEQPKRRGRPRKTPAN